MSDRLPNTVAELKAAEAAARTGDAYDLARDLDCAAAEFVANQKLNTTLSTWTARNRESGRRWACIVCALLTVGFNLLYWRRVTRDHCADALAK